VAAIAGTRPAWIHTTTVDTAGTAASGAGTRTRGYEYVIYPDQIKQLPVGCAAVITPGRGSSPRSRGSAGRPDADAQIGSTIRPK